MDRLLARKIERDEQFRKKLLTIARNYLKVGRDTLSYWVGEFDVAYDILMGYSQLSRQDLNQLEKGHPKRFIMPLTSTQITTMATYISQVLFGQETPWKVEARGPKEEIPAEFMNQLLRWNAEQQQTYTLGYLWVQDALSVNRGIFYNQWAPLFKNVALVEEVPDPEGEVDEFGMPEMYQRTRMVSEPIGGFNKMTLVSPYDFICDPMLPLSRLQDMRFCGHRFILPWWQLEARSRLPLDDPAYVMPWAIKELKDKNTRSGSLTESEPSVGTMTSGSGDIRVSRTAYERGRTNTPLGSEKADGHDGGNVECYEMWIRIIPKDYEIHEGEEPVLYQFLIGNGNIVLAVSESTYQHGQFPYSIGEGRPHAHIQFSPGWVMVMKGIQDHVDWLKNRHQEALSRTVGNIFIADPSKVDLDDFLNPEKEGVIIPLKPDAYGSKISDVIQQVPIKDMTENFHEEMMSFVNFSESVTAANSSMQGMMGGNLEGGATQFAGTQQMAAGRMTSIARLLSCSALVPQAKQFVSNFQQFMDTTQQVRFMSSNQLDLPPELAKAKYVELSRDVIQGEFDFISHDGTLPGTDSRKVAAITRLLEASGALPQIFVPAPGNIDPRALVFAGAKASGLSIENFLYDPATLAQAAGAPPPAPPAGGPLPDMGNPGAAPQNPGPAPMMPATPELAPITLPSASAPEIRPGNY